MLAAALLMAKGEHAAGVTSVVTGLAWLGFGAVPRANRHNAAAIAAVTAAASLVVTWTSAALGALLYASFAAGDSSAKIWIPIMLLAATNLGGLLAVFRSAQTRTETSAALRELSDLRIAVLSAPVIEAADRARRASTVDELSVGYGSMLQLAVSLSLLPRAVDQASLWAKDPINGEWFICAATTPPREQGFRQRVIDRATPGAGVVANLAVATPPPHAGTVHRDDVLLIAEAVRTHPWYVANPAQSHPAEGMAVVMLRRDREAIGALCFTWETRVIPTTGSRAEEMIDILQRWAHAFGIALARLYQLRDELSQP